MEINWVGFRGRRRGQAKEPQDGAQQCGGQLQREAALAQMKILAFIVRALRSHWEDLNQSMTHGGVCFTKIPGASVEHRRN